MGAILSSHFNLPTDLFQKKLDIDPPRLLLYIDWLSNPSIFHGIELAGPGGGHALTTKDLAMNRVYVFIIRAVLGLAFAALLLRFFYPAATYVHMALLAVFLTGMAYVSEYFRKRDAE